jgi:adenylate cyclase, class 2
MPKNKSSQEIEIKLRVADIELLCRRLKQLHARQVVPRTFEVNILYDTLEQSLRHGGKLIRIRFENECRIKRSSRSAGPNSAILTFKGPAPSPRGPRTSAARPIQRSRFKIRKEIEVTVNDGAQLAEILQGLGLRPSFRYEKFRTTYVLAGIEDLKLELDETPIGLFLELEGSERSIDCAAKLLGYARSDYVIQTYGALFIAHCRIRRRKPRNMVFPTTKKLR